MLSCNRYSTVGLSVYSLRAGQRFMNVNWPKPEAFDDDLETVFLDIPEDEVCLAIQKMIEETDDAA